MAETLHNALIVLDNGSGTIRAGFIADDLPKCYFLFFVGRPKHIRVLAGALEGDVFIGRRAEELQGLLTNKICLEAWYCHRLGRYEENLVIRLLRGAQGYE